ncbi:putative P450 monooxygenase [Zymoseptoria tritici IPO323]|uniref:P450 monooxygenase n=1 Tax=Zymoseptoria tritici (strain CBS 115943 / IPO323) TaxID=336722 RepID=F9XNX8_ZYMTI|nr:putative P450 monooxygenase [Zymoseptoria tritici IPO323]EGP82950.1 putative P450 monooxygenase [Zymoseptoria tritici IPO323]
MILTALYGAFEALIYGALPTILIIVVGGSIVLGYTTLSDIPGPFYAKFTDYWRFRVVGKRNSHETYLKLHEEYGDFVRIGPNCVSISRPDVIPLIYGINVKATKSDFYTVWQNVVNGKRTASLVFTTDEAHHATMKRPIANAYSLSTLVEFEPLIDSTTAVFLSRLDSQFASTGAVCDLGTWLQWYAFDVIGELTLSKRLGFLEKGEDVENIAANVARNFDRCSSLGQMPWLDLIYKHPYFQALFLKSPVNPIIAFGQRRLQERLDDNEDTPPPTDLGITDPSLAAKVLHTTLPSKPDFLSRFLTLHETQPEIVTENTLLAYLFMNINAGSDTIASTVRALFYHLLRHPSTLTTLMTELDAAHEAGNLTLPLPTWSEVQPLPYLSAVVKESLRLNPALALPLERIVPAAGITINGTFFPPNTVIGVNPWVLHRDTRIFGSDAKEWNPSRWIDGDAERTRYMESHLLSFGAGKRTCLGRNIAILELSKVVPAILCRYKMRLEDEGREWKVVNSWAVRQEGLEVLLERR